MFSPAIVFHRTQAGKDEIQQKSHGLTQSERLVLIMVDGVSTYKQVRSKLPVLADDRFSRAVHKLQAKELILEVFLPVEGQEPEEIERTVIDRFLQQDPLDPVTIIMRDPDDELEFLARYSSSTKSATSSDSSPSRNEKAGFSTMEESAMDQDTASEANDGNEIHSELIERLATELKERQQSRPQRIDRVSSSGKRSASHDRLRDTRARLEEPQPKTASPYWGYWLIAIGIAFIAGYFLARFGA